MFEKTETGHRRCLPWLAILLHLRDNIVFDISISISAPPVENTIDINELNNLSLDSHRFVEEDIISEVARNSHMIQIYMNSRQTNHYNPLQTIF